MRPFFDGRNLPKNPVPEYVAWVDVMGTQARMSRSLEQTANFVFKLHVAAIDAINAATDGGLSVYPVMDGLYASSTAQRIMLNFLRGMFKSLAEEFCATRQELYRFIVRGGLAFGPTVHGRSIPETASRQLASKDWYRNSILLGMPMVQAHLCESKAPPFGIFVHESARALAPVNETPLHELWWRWAEHEDSLWTQVGTALDKHLEWCEKRALPLEYSEDRIKAHRGMAKQYFMPLMDHDAVDQADHTAPQRES